MYTYYRYKCPENHHIFGCTMDKCDEPWLEWAGPCPGPSRWIERRCHSASARQTRSPHWPGRLGRCKTPVHLVLFPMHTELRSWDSNTRRKSWDHVFWGPVTVVRVALRRKWSFGRVQCLSYVCTWLTEDQKDVPNWPYGSGSKPGAANP